MKISTILKSLTVATVFLLPIACSHVDEKKSVIVNQDQSASSIISNLKRLDVDKNIITNDPDLRLFLDGHEHIKVGTIDKAQAIFTSLQNSQSKEAKEYGEYGLLLLAYETENMFNMQRHIQNIEKLENKSDWLEKDLKNYKVVYNFTAANFDQVEDLLKRTPATETIDSPLLTSIKAGMYIRKNKLHEAENILNSLKGENEDSIAMSAKLIYLNKGSKAAVDYLAKKSEKYPYSEDIELIYNDYLAAIDIENTIKNSYKLGLNTKNSFFLLYSMSLLYADANNNDTLDKINELQSKIDKSDVVKCYIDYYLVRLILPLNPKEKSINIATASEFNPMNYTLLWHKYYDADEEDKLEFLRKIEKIDPYDNYILMELAKFYSYHSMKKELTEIKQRFSNSKRLKTDNEIEFMETI